MLREVFFAFILVTSLLAVVLRNCVYFDLLIDYFYDLCGVIESKSEIGIHIVHCRSYSTFTLRIQSAHTITDEGGYVIFSNS